MEVVPHPQDRTHSREAVEHDARSRRPGQGARIDVLGRGRFDVVIAGLLFITRMRRSAVIRRRNFTETS